ncbi:MAG: metallophosphoesterase, partial [Cyclobacteriaceae bacterium]|nr:metallophosphoesterase [Cyclobacteriaceae bacterium]
MEQRVQLTAGKKIYFASDFHLGVPDYASSLAREKLIVKWLDTIAADAQAIYLLGDIFDFWFEYRKAIPKGFIRLQGKLAELRDAGMPIFFFTGNHDMWMFDYFE